MKKIALFLFLVASGYQAYACTNLLAGKLATTDGSTMITYAADSYALFGALYHYPARTYPEGAMLDIYEWDTGKYLGQIKQATQTYSVIGNMNEYQVSIAETTFGGREELVDTTGIIDYGSLMYIALQRSRSAREAIRVMTTLVEEYGYYSSGESFSIADPNEVWIMEMIGKGPKNKGAVWVAQRIPDDCIAAHANQARITTFPFDDKNNCLYSVDVIAFAREKGYFKGRNKDFSFSDVYAPLDYGALRACEARVWSFFRQASTGMDHYIDYVSGESAERMPLWVKPAKKLSVEDMKNFMRDQYEGTPLDITKGVGAGMYGSKLRLSPLSFKLDGETYYHERPIATQQTGFSFVAQMRNWLPPYIGGILWFGVDDAAFNIYTPMYCGINSVPTCYSETNGSLLEYSPTSAFWVYNQVSNFAYAKYSLMIDDIRKTQKHWESNFRTLIPSIDKTALDLPETAAREFLTTFSHSQAENSTTAWRRLGEYLLVKNLDGVVKKEENGQFLMNDKKIPQGIIRPGYPEEVLRQMVKENPGMKAKTQVELDSLRN
ncbi:MAG: dipeptidase [Paludibacter sp. 47-17]|jgi:dipeptidase|nr:MAG: peptidase C69 [Paludibacter sp. SCN 50-10]ODU60421.1 MAG: peptidase C69 [Paludibacter sp. SCN 51-9]OJX91212.1 MAG: dipeptidase [Paludibacter sp. 47-17]